MDKRIVLKEFTVEAEIFHMDLPEKVANVLISDGFTPKQDLYYDVFGTSTFAALQRVRLAYNSDDSR